MRSDNRGSFVLELDALRGRALESLRLHGLLVQWLQRALVQVVRVGNELFKLLPVVRSRGPAWLEPGSEDLSLVVLKVVVLILALLDGGVENSLLASEALLTRLSLELGACLREVVCRLSGRFEAVRVQIVVDLLSVTAGKKVDAVYLRVGKLLRRQPLDIFLQVVRVVSAIAPWLLRRSGLLGQEILLALHCVLLVLVCLRARELHSQVKEVG